MKVYCSVIQIGYVMRYVLLLSPDTRRVVIPRLQLYSMLVNGKITATDTMPDMTILNIACTKPGQFDVPISSRPMVLCLQHVEACAYIDRLCIDIPAHDSTLVSLDIDSVMAMHIETTPFTNDVETPTHILTRTRAFDTPATLVVCFDMPRSTVSTIHVVAPRYRLAIVRRDTNLDHCCAFATDKRLFLQPVVHVAQDTRPNARWVDYFLVAGKIYDRRKHVPCFAGFIVIHARHALLGYALRSEIDYCAQSDVDDACSITCM